MLVRLTSQISNGYGIRLRTAGWPRLDVLRLKDLLSATTRDSDIAGGLFVDLCSRRQVVRFGLRSLASGPVMMGVHVDQLHDLEFCDCGLMCGAGCDSVSGESLRGATFANRQGSSRRCLCRWLSLR